MSIFGELEKEDTANDQLRRQQVSKSRAKKHVLQRAAALAEDASVYDYDGVYDEIQDNRNEKVQQKEAQKVERKSRYIGHLLKKAKSREIESSIIQERKLLKDREETDHLFGDKEKFVTSAYKEKLKEDERWQQEEAKREALETDVRTKDMSSFYSSVLHGGLHGGLTRSRGGGQAKQEAQEREREKELQRATRLASERQKDQEQEEQQSHTRPTRADPSPKRSKTTASQDEKAEEAEATEEEIASARRAAKLRTQREITAKKKEALAKPPPKALDLSRRNDDGAVQSARERYLARKRAQQNK